MHKIQIHVIGSKVLQRCSDALLDALVPWVVQLGGQEDLLAGHAGGLDAAADFSLVAVGKGSVDVAVARAESRLNGFLYLIGAGLPRA